MEKLQTPGVLERISLLYTSLNWHDIEFHLSDRTTGEVVVAKAHRLILSSCSPVFEALCFGPMAEKSAVSVPDIDPTAFNVMLKYLYTDKVEFSSVDVASSIYYAGKKYLIHSLCTLASIYLFDNIDESNCFELFNLANMFDDESLFNRVWDYIRSHLNYIAKFANSENLSCELIVKLVNEHVLDGDEITLVLLAQMWAEECCNTCGIEKNSNNIRNILMQYNIFQKIRWRLLGEDDLCLILPGLLTEEEISMLLSPKKRRSATNYLEMSRMKPPLKLVYIHRYVEEKTLRSDLPDALTISTVITVNRSVALHGIFVSGKIVPLIYNIPFAPAAPRYMEHISLSILETNSNVIISSKDFKEEVKYGSPFYVKLDHPLPLVAGKSNDIRIRLYKSVCHYEFAWRNMCGKVPSGLTVTFKESAKIGTSDRFIPAPYLSLLTGLEFSW